MAYLLQELPGLGAECHVACRKGSAFERYCLEQQVPHVALPFANELDLYTAWHVKQYCRQHGIGLVHLHSGHSHAIGLWAHVLGNKIPLVLHRRVDFPVKPNALSCFKYNYPGIKKIICVSDEVRRILSQDLRHPERCLTIYDCIDPGRFQRTSSDTTSDAAARNHSSTHLLIHSSPQKLRREYLLPPYLPIIANVAALAPHKDYFTFIDTVAELVRLGVPAVFMAIGEGALRAELEAYAASKGLKEKLLFTGFRNDVTEILPELAVLLITSKTEGLGSVILEAFAAGVPVVGTAAGGIPEVVIPEQTGLLAPVGDAAALARQVQRVLTETGLADRLRQGADALVRQLSCTTIAAQTKAVYEEALALT